jgi:hypothetical protein
VAKLPEVQRRERTEFKEFILSQPTMRAEKENFEEPKSSFKALALNKKIMERPDFQPMRGTFRPLTETQPFNFATDHRMTIAVQKRESYGESESTPTFRARPMPNFNAMTTKVKNDVRRRSLTKCQEFKLSENPMRSERKSISVDTMEANKFKARPMPDFNCMRSTMQPKYAEKQLTMAVPFSFATDSRSTLKESKKVTQE